MKKMLIGTVFAAALVGLPALSQAQILIAAPPPPMQAEIPPPVGGPGQTWIPGHWDAPPMMGARWVPARWIRRGPMWMYSPGRWRGPRGWLNAPGQVMVPGGQPMMVQQPPMVVQQPPMVVQQPQVVMQQPPMVVQQPMQQPTTVYVGGQPGPQGIVVGQPGGVYMRGPHGRHMGVMQPGVPMGQPMQQGVVVQQPMQPGVVMQPPMQQGVVVGQPVQPGTVYVGPRGHRGVMVPGQPGMPQQTVIIRR